MAALAIRGLEKRYGRTQALAGVELEVGEGELVGLLGPNGAGKSTLVKIACGLVRATAGHAEVCGRPAWARSAATARDRLTSRSCSAFPAGRARTRCSRCTSASPARPAAKRNASSCWRSSGFARARETRVEAMSKGMQQRLGIAQALVGSPPLLLLDEPTSALDPAGRRAVRDVLEELRRRGIAVLLNSHLLSEVELVCDRVAILREGRVVAAGAPDDLARPRGVEIETDEGVVHIDGGREEAARAVAELVAAGRKVFRVDVRRSTLEEVYLEAVGETE